MVDMFVEEEMVKVLPSTSVLSMSYSISEPLLKVSTQLMVGRGRPSAVQLRESPAGVRTWTVVTGDSVTVGGTKKEE